MNKRKKKTRMMRKKKTRRIVEAVMKAWTLSDDYLEGWKVQRSGGECSAVEVLHG